MNMNALKLFFKNYVYPVATLSGSVIGVGFLALPYIALKVGITAMLFYFVVLVGIILCINLLFGEISLKTPDFKRFPGFVGFYLGKWAKRVTLCSEIAGSSGVLLVYVIIGGQFLADILVPLFGGSALWYSLIFLVAASICIYFGTTLISHFEFGALVLLAVILVIIFIKGFGHIAFSNILLHDSQTAMNWKTLFLPYGAIIFSLWGTGLIPETEEMLKKNKKSLKKIIVASTLIPAAFYLIFIFLILGISGAQTTESSLGGLAHFLGQGVIAVAVCIGVITTFTAFLTQGLLLKKICMYDMNMKPVLAWLFTCVPPLVLFLLGFNSFVYLISFIGGVLLSVDGILILLMYQKIGGKRMIIYPLAVVFLAAILYEIVFFIT